MDALLGVGILSSMRCKGRRRQLLSAVDCHRFGKASLLAGTTRAIEIITVESREQARGKKAAASRRFGKASLLAGTARAIEIITVESREQARGQKAAASRRTQKLSRLP